MIYRENRTLIMITIVIFCISVVIGGIFETVVPTSLNGSHDGTDVPGPLFFFVNNSRLAVALLVGSLSFGIVTILILFQNGALLGASLVAMHRSVGPVTAAVIVTPHGVIEFLAFCLAAAAGLKAPYEIVLYLFEAEKTILQRSEVIDIIKLFVVSVVLLGIAAVVESRVTPTLLRVVGQSNV